MSSYGVWLSATGMKVCEHRQTLHAHNLANAQTTGFKSDLAEVWQRPVESREPATAPSLRHPILDQLSGGVNVHQSLYDFTQGNIENTGRPLDVAIRGDGFFTVSDGPSKRLTRDGEFTLSPTGDLVLADASGSWRLLDQDNRPVRVDPALGPVSIGASGLVRQGTQSIAQIRLLTPENPQALRRIGANQFAYPSEDMRVAAGTLVSAAREESNYNEIVGLTQMIEASRAYEMNATLFQLQDDTIGQAVNTLGRVA